MPLMEISTGRVIEAVKARTCLWNPSDPLSKNKQTRNAAWLEVTRRVVPDFDEFTSHKQKIAERAVQQRWKTARDAYMRNKALYKCGATKKKYFYFNQCSFLDQLGPGWYNNKVPRTLEKVVAAEEAKKIALASLRNTDKKLTVEVQPPETINPSTSSSPVIPILKPATQSDSEDPLATLTSQVMIKQEPIDDYEDHDNNYDDPENSSGEQHSDLDVDNERVPETKQSVKTEPKIRPIRKVMKRKLVRNDINFEVYRTVKETAEHIKNEDMAFFMSIVPTVSQFTTRQKLIFRQAVMKAALDVLSLKENEN